MNTDFDKILDIIKSCNTKNQLLNCEGLIEGFLKKHKNNDLAFMLCVLARTIKNEIIKHEELKTKIANLISDYKTNNNKEAKTYMELAEQIIEIVENG